jgi:hypothetical protein
MLTLVDCKYVGSRSLLNLCDRKSTVPVPDFEGLNPALYDNLSPNEVIHVCPQALKNFVKKVLPKITDPFVLVTNNSDWTIPDDVSQEFDILINNPYLVRWFSQNCVIYHPKLVRIPIGLDYHTLTPSRKQHFAWSLPEKHSWGIKQEPLVQEEFLIQLKNYSLPFWERDYKAYANFHFLMTTRYGKTDRVDALNTVPKHLVFYEPAKCYRDICWRNMIKYAFVMSPHGNGLDCHRTWEALCLGCIPIVKRSGIDELFENLPVWIVDSWSEVTEENMKRKINEFRERTFEYRKLELAYWRARIYGEEPS